jgi:hypothetical protein
MEYHSGCNIQLQEPSASSKNLHIFQLKTWKYIVDKRIFASDSISYRSSQILVS